MLPQVQRYGRMWLCGPFLPSSFLVQRSKFSKLTVKFKSNASVTRLGFRAEVVATGTTTRAAELAEEKFDSEIEEERRKRKYDHEYYNSTST